MAQLITPAELDDLLRSAPVRVLDVRYRLDRPDGTAEHLEGHVPGAVYVDMETELSQHGRADEGRHPLPPLGALQAAARRWGIGDGDTVALRALFATVGVGDGVSAAAYCGSGVTAAQAVFAAELAGLELGIYPGSWSQWSNTPGRPVATGPAPAEITGTV